MIKKSLLALGAACIMAIPAFAADWVQVSPNKYVDAASIRPSNAYGTFTFKAKAIADGVPFERYNGRDVWQVNGSMYVNCRSGYLREVSYSMFDDNNKLIINVKNDYDIIPKEKLKTLFEKFTRVDDSTTRTTRGTGLGLFIVKGLVEAMNGEIKISSNENCGFAVKVSMPIANKQA